MDEQWIGPAVLTGLSTLAGIAYAAIKAWDRDRARLSRAQTTVDLARTERSTREISKLVRVSQEDESSEP
jgi:hypothetical protein